MKFSCDQCNAQYMIADEKVGERGVKVKCKKCAHIIVVRPVALAPEPSAAAAPAPQQVSAPAIAAPPAGNGGTEWNVGGSYGGDAAAGAGSSDLGLGAAWGASAPVKVPAPASQRPRGEKEWYVAIDDSQLGPVDIGDIEEKWDSEDVDEDTLVWKAGMGDWCPLAEVPDLAYLITERPQASRRRAAVSTAAVGVSAGLAAASASALASGPVSFGGGADLGSESSWKPSAASALSSLVEDELQAAETKASAPVMPKAASASLGMPSFAAGELFGGGGNGGGVAIPDMGRASGGPSLPAPDPFAGGVPAWSAGPTRRSGGLRAVHVAIGGMAFLMVAVVAVGALVVLRTPGGLAALVGPAAPVAATTVAPAAAPHAGAQVAAAPAGTPAPPAASAGTDEDRKAGRKRAAPAVTPAKAAPAPAKAAGRRGGENIDDVFDAPAAPKGPPVKAKLTVQDIVETVKTQGRNVSPCIQRARSSGEIVAGPYTFKLNWTIRPDGSVTNPQLTGPANVLNTSLPDCFVSQMRKWDFPPSQAGAPVANFPFGPVRVP